jgi:large conductance mechanosensitive channel protein
MKEDEILEELRRIRTLLEPKPPSPAPRRDLWTEFVEFVKGYKVMGTAVGFIMGLYFGSLIQALVGDLIMPVMQFATPGVSWESIQVGPFRVGHFIGTTITFLIVAFVIFLVARLTRKWGME